MAGKGIPKNVIRNFVRHVDILPTICDILDFKMPKKINGVTVSYTHLTLPTILLV